MQRPDPDRAGIAEGIIRVHLGGQPAIGADLAVQLARPPARVTEREDRLFRPPPLGQFDQNVAGGGQLQPGPHIHAAIMRRQRFRVQHEAAHRLDRAAGAHGQVGGVVHVLDPQQVQQFGELHVLHRLVQHDPHRPIIRMGADQHNRAPKARVAHVGHGDQDLAGQVAVRRHIKASCPQDRGFLAFRQGLGEKVISASARAALWLSP